MRVVFNGAGAAGIACAEHYVRLGREAREHHPLRHQGCGLQGPQRRDESLQRSLRPEHRKLRTLAEAMVGADVFAGLSVEGAINGT